MTLLRPSVAEAMLLRPEPVQAAPADGLSSGHSLLELKVLDLPRKLKGLAKARPGEDLVDRADVEDPCRSIGNLEGGAVTE